MWHVGSSRWLAISKLLAHALIEPAHFIFCPGLVSLSQAISKDRCVANQQLSAALSSYHCWESPSQLGKPRPPALLLSPRFQQPLEFFWKMHKVIAWLDCKELLITSQLFTGCHVLWVFECIAAWFWSQQSVPGREGVPSSWPALCCWCWPLLSLELRPHWETVCDLPNPTNKSHTCWHLLTVLRHT